MLNQKKIAFFVFFFIFFFVAVLSAAEVKPGDVIDSSNVDQYKEYIPQFMAQFIKDGYGLVTPAAPIHVADHKTLMPPESFMKASVKNKGRVTINPEDLTLTGFDYSGFPFPEVKEPYKAEKIIVNFYYRWRADDFYYEDNDMMASTSQRKGGRLSRHNSKSGFLRYIGRTAPGFEKDLPNPNGLYWSLVTRFMQPAFKNLRTLQWRYIDPSRNDDMWSYVPTLRRTLRMISSERANPINGTPLTYDDIYGFDGQLSQFSYKFIQDKKMIAMLNLDINAHYERSPQGFYDHPVYYGPDYPYGIADGYVIEVVPKNSKYPESKKVLYMNTENYYSMYSEVYDKQGGLWKGWVFNIAERKTEAGEKSFMNAQAGTDFKTGMWIQIVTNKSIQDSGLTPDIFGPANFYTW